MSARGCSLTPSLCGPEALAISRCRKASRMAGAKPGLSDKGKGRSHVLLEESTNDQGEIHCQLTDCRIRNKFAMGPAQVLKSNSPLISFNSGKDRNSKTIKLDGAISYIYIHKNYVNLRAIVVAPTRKPLKIFLFWSIESRHLRKRLEWADGCPAG